VRGLSKDPDHRYADVVELAAALRAAVEGAAAAGTRASPPATIEAAPALTPIDRLAGVAPAGRETKRLIRRMRRTNGGPRRIVALALAAAIAAFVWYHPSTREQTRAAWRQLGDRVHHAIERVTASRSDPVRRSATAATD
jgi:hypothetical protein